MLQHKLLSKRNLSYGNMIQHLFFLKCASCYSIILSFLKVFRVLKCFDNTKLFDKPAPKKVHFNKEIFWLNSEISFS